MGDTAIGATRRKPGQEHKDFGRIAESEILRREMIEIGLGNVVKFFRFRLACGEAAGYALKTLSELALNRARFPPAQLSEQ